ncbi:MAG: hypothetical protein Q7J85_02850 [Bacillota bacterium]|nr:hypothetical protein [Bacillota bacterium]
MEGENMGLVLDKREDKSLAQLCSYLDLPVSRAANKNGNGWLEQVLSCIGLSSLIKEYGASCETARKCVMFPLENGSNFIFISKLLTYSRKILSGNT